MSLTTAARLNLSREISMVFDRMGQIHGKLKHKLFAEMAKTGGVATDYKTAFIAKYNITAREFNALATSVQGMINGTKELLKDRLHETYLKLEKVSEQLREVSFQLVEINRRAISTSTKKFNRLCKTEYQLKIKQRRLAEKLKNLEEQFNRPVPRICFGTNKLFKKQFHLELNGYARHDEWRTDWQTARSNQFYFVGSKDETAGNQLCTAFIQEDGLLTLRIRKPNELCATKQDKYVVISDIDISYLKPALYAIIEKTQRDKTGKINGVALTYRFIKDKRGWQAQISFSLPAATLCTLNKQYGVMGVDFNGDHLAVTETDRNGNFINSWRFDLPVEGLSTGQRKTLLEKAIHDIGLLCLAAEKPMVIENLDFAAKKRQMSNMTAAQNRALSSLMYAKYQQQVASMCHRQGIELLKINPAYTSFIGLVKYKRKAKISGHAAAAGVIGRIGQGFSNRYPSRLRDRMVAGPTVTWILPARNKSADDRGQWVAATKQYKTGLKGRAYQNPTGWSRTPQKKVGRTKQASLVSQGTAL